MSVSEAKNLLFKAPRHQPIPTLLHSTAAAVAAASCCSLPL